MVYLDDALFEKCLISADKAIRQGLMQDMDLFAAADLLYALETEKIEKDSISDENINYNDEIISIEYLGEKQTIDISVSGDNLFYCNNILTKNSFGLPMTLDFLFTIIRTEELDKMGQLMVKQLKSRYGDVNYYKRFVLGIDLAKFRLYDIDESEQPQLSDSGKKEKDVPAFDNSKFGNAMKKRRNYIAADELNFD